MKKSIIAFCAIALGILLGFVFQHPSINSKVIDSYIKNNSNNLSSNAIISITFDDGFINQYKLAYPILSEYGYNATAFIISNWSKPKFEGQDIMTFSQAKNLQDHGWEIGSHGYDHQRINSITSEFIEKEIVYSKEILQEQNLTIEGIAFPFGLSNQESINLTRAHYKYSRPLSAGFNDPISFDKYGLRSIWIKKSDTHREICYWINYAKENNLWIILTFHDVANNKESEWDTSVEDFREIVSCIKDSKIQVKTVYQVVKNN